MRANYIYTRIIDKNTPIDKGADHKQFPELRIEFTEPKEGNSEVYSYFFEDPQSLFGKAKLLYHSTILAELDYCTVDEDKLTIGYPRRKHFFLGKDHRRYYYYDGHSLDGAFHFFLTDGKIEQSVRAEKSPFLFFKSQEDQKQFEEYLTENIEAFNQLPPDGAFIALKHLKEKAEDNKKPLIEFLHKTRLMFERWRQETAILSSNLATSQSKEPIKQSVQQGPITYHYFRHPCHIR